MFGCNPKNTSRRASLFSSRRRENAQFCSRKLHIATVVEGKNVRTWLDFSMERVAVKCSVIEKNTNVEKYFTTKKTKIKLIKQSKRNKH